MPDRKIIFAVNLPLKLFPATVANADIGSLKSLHTFLKKCLYNMQVNFEENHMVQTKRNFELFEKKQGFYKPLFQRSKSYGSPTRVTRLKVAPNMADPISIKDSDRCILFSKKC